MKIYIVTAEILDCVETPTYAEIFDTVEFYLSRESAVRAINHALNVDFPDDPMEWKEEESGFCKILEVEVED